MLSRVVAAAATATLYATLGSAAYAATEPSGSITWEPASGSIYAGIWVKTDGPCAKQATNVYAKLSGPGLDSAGMVVIPNASVGVSTTEPMILPLQDNLYNFAQRASLQRLDGTYKLDVLCTDSFGVEVFTTYSSSIAIDQGKDKSLEDATYATGPGVADRDDDSRSTQLYVLAGLGVVGAAVATWTFWRRSRRQDA